MIVPMASPVLIDKLTSAEDRGSRIHLHYTPAYTSWLNQVEIRFHRITGRGTFGSMRELAEKIDRYVHTYHPTAQPFVWTATAGSIFAKVQRLCNRISRTLLRRCRQSSGRVRRARYDKFIRSDVVARTLWPSYAIKIGRRCAERCARVYSWAGRFKMEIT